MGEPAVSAGLNAFLSQAPEGANETLCLLAQAESLTDATAEQIYNLAPVAGVSAEIFIQMLHYTDLIRPRNSEWHFSPTVRADLLAREAPPESVTATHELLVSIARYGDRAEARTRIPSYLFTEAGEAYHLAELGEVQAALPLYSAAAMEPLSGRQWLAGRLATEQERRQRIPEGTIEVTFLRGMLLYREGHKEEAMELFRLLVDKPDDRLEVAIAQHLYANSIARLDLKAAEAYYRRSLEINRRLDKPEHIAQVLHSLANLLSGQRSRWREAEEMFREALTYEEADSLGAVKTLHSLGNLIARNPKRLDEAEATYRKILEVGKPIAEAQVLHSLAILIARDESRAKEAEKLYRDSLKAGEGNSNHVAQTLRSLALLVQNWSIPEAVELLQRSLEINRRNRNTEGARLVKKSLRDLTDRSS